MNCTKLLTLRGTARGLWRSLTTIAKRPKLPGSNGKGFPQYLNEPKADFPFRVLAQDYGLNHDAPPEECAKAISDSLKLLTYEHGVILLQGFPLGQHTKFKTFLRNLEGVTPMSYTHGGGARHSVDDKVYAASDYAADGSIDPHSEMSHTTIYPNIVSFACKQPGIGGESILIDNNAWYDQIDRAVTDEFIQKGGIQYHVYLRENDESYGGQKLGADISWKHTFETDSKAEVEHQMKTHKREYIWHEDNAVEYWYTGPISINHHKTGKLSWFNQVTIHHTTFYTEMYPDTWGKSNIPVERFPFHTYYADGSDIHPDVIQHIRNVGWSLAVGFQLQKNEVVFIDNEKFAHARLDYTGERKLFAAFLRDNDKLGS